VPAIHPVAVFATLRAKTLAIRLAYGLDGNFEQCILALERGKVNLAVLRYQQVGFRNGALVKCVQVGERPVDGLLERIQAADAIEIQFRGELPLEQQALRLKRADPVKSFTVRSSPSHIVS
jgi:hypothetical protein